MQINSLLNIKKDRALPHITCSVVGGHVLTLQ